MLTAFIAEGLGQRCLDRSGLADEGEVPVGVYWSKGSNALELFQVGKILDPKYAKVEVLKCLGHLLWSRLMRWIEILGLTNLRLDCITALRENAFA